MLILSYIIFILVNLFVFMNAIKENIKGRYKTTHFAIYLYILFFVFPICLDLTIGKPIYDNYPGFFEATRDEITLIIYNFLMILPPLIWLIFKNKYYLNIKDIKFVIPSIKNPFILYILIIFTISPIILFLLSPAPEVYFFYGSRSDLMNTQEKEFHAFLGIFIMISLFTCLYFIALSRNIYITILFFLPILGMDFWLHGKRSIVFTMLIILFLVIIIKRKIRGSKLIILSTVVAILLLSFSVFYQTEIRTVSSLSEEKQYENFRVDFGRDDETKLSLYRELNEGNSILDYRGQSFLFYLAFYVPREFWSDKPYPYAQYLTSSLFNASPKLWGWGMTTSIFGESIANFSYFGIILSSFFILFITNIADKSRNLIYKVFTMLLVMNFLTVHLVAFMPTFLLYVLFSLYVHKKEKTSIV